VLDSDEDEQDRAVVEEDLSKAPMQTAKSREAHRKNKENRLTQAIYSNRFFTRENNPFSIDRYLLNPESYIMDAKTCGNIGRYFNHSCSPNMFVQNVFVDTYDLRFPWIAFFASCSIKAGTELCWVLACLAYFEFN
jgi:histone-lysine N-methyltransferase SETDB1